jgi:integrase/recombinase XerD
MNPYSNQQWKNLEGGSTNLQRAVPGESDYILRENILDALTSQR